MGDSCTFCSYYWTVGILGACAKGSLSRNPYRPPPKCSAFEHTPPLRIILCNGQSLVAEILSNETEKHIPHNCSM